MQSQQNLNLVPLSLPKGGGASQGMGESLGSAGPDGMASLSIPLPLSAGCRGRRVFPWLRIHPASRHISAR